MWEAGRTIFEYLEAINEQELSGGKSTERSQAPSAVREQHAEAAQVLGVHGGFQP